MAGRFTVASGAALFVCAFGCTAGVHAPGYLRAVPARDPVRAARLNEQGLALLEREAFAEAEGVFRQALQADPYFGMAHCNLGVSLLKQGRFYDAGWAFDHAGKLMPRAAQPRVNLGVLFEAAGLYGEAEEQLRKALELAPADVEIVGQLARLHVRQNKHTAETLAWLKTVASQDDDAAWRTWARTELTKTRNHPESRESP